MMNDINYSATMDQVLPGIIPWVRDKLLIDNMLHNRHIRSMIELAHPDLFGVEKFTCPGAKTAFARMATNSIRRSARLRQRGVTTCDICGYRKAVTSHEDVFSSTPIRRPYCRECSEEHQRWVIWLQRKRRAFFQCT